MSWLSTAAWPFNLDNVNVLAMVERTMISVCGRLTHCARTLCLVLSRHLFYVLSRHVFYV